MPYILPPNYAYSYGNVRFIKIVMVNWRMQYNILVKAVVDRNPGIKYHISSEALR